MVYVVIIITSNCLMKTESHSSYSLSIVVMVSPVVYILACSSFVLEICYAVGGLCMS